MYAKLVAYKKKYGHCDVKQRENEEFEGLGNWVQMQRRRKRGNGGYRNLTEGEIDRLDSLGFSWAFDYTDKMWDDKFERLEQFRRTNGHCNVPVFNYDKDPKLSRWCNNQKWKNNKGTLRPDRKAKLQSIGFLSATKKKKTTAPKVNPAEVLKWRVQQQWNASLTRLVEFRTTHGHWRVPAAYEKDTSLAQWVQNQRNARQTMIPERRERLNSVGFPWIENDQDVEADNEGSATDATEYVTANETLDSDDDDKDVKSVSCGTLKPEFAKVQVGSRLEVHWPYDDMFYEATVTHKEKTRCCVVYDSGEYEWIDHHQRSFRLVQEEETQTCIKAEYPIGTKVRTFFDCSGWWNGEVTSYDGEHYQVVYEDGDTEEYVAKDLAPLVLSPELAKVEIGSRVAVKWPTDQKYYIATVTRERNEEKPFCVMYDTGDYEWLDLRHCKFRLVGEKRQKSSNDNKYPVGTKVRKVGCIAEYGSD